MHARAITEVLGKFPLEVLYLIIHADVRPDWIRGRLSPSQCGAYPGQGMAIIEMSCVCANYGRDVFKSNYFWIGSKMRLNFLIACTSFLCVTTRLVI